MTAPTTRETADHAELARLRQHIANLKLRPGHHVQFGTPSVSQISNYWNRDLADDLEALLSEIAALRGEVASLEIRRDFFKHNMTQAERQRDELRKALEFYGDPDAYTEVCRNTALGDDDGLRARQALANQGAD